MRIANKDSLRHFTEIRWPRCFNTIKYHQDFPHFNQIENRYPVEFTEAHLKAFQKIYPELVLRLVSVILVGT